MNRLKLRNIHMKNKLTSSFPDKSGTKTTRLPRVSMKPVEKLCVEPTCLNILVQDVMRRVQGENWMPRNKAMDGVDEPCSTCRHAVLVPHLRWQDEGGWLDTCWLHTVCLFLPHFFPSDCLWGFMWLWRSEAHRTGMGHMTGRSQSACSLTQWLVFADMWLNPVEWAHPRSSWNCETKAWCLPLDDVESGSQATDCCSLLFSTTREAVLKKTPGKEGKTKRHLKMQSQDPSYLILPRIKQGFPGGKEPAYQCRRWQENRVRSLSRKKSPEEEMATHSNILAWEIP